MAQGEGKIGPYVIEGELGRGGMGVVYRARHELNGQQVAIKQILDPLTAAALVARFQREGRALAALSHPNVVGVHSAGEHQGRPYLALEFVEGRALDAELKRGGPWSERRAAALVRTLALALAHAHAHGILHRDLKPANVLLDADDTPHVTDFGLAREPGADREQLTLTGEILGTPSFMAPEQANGQTDVDARADVYGLGAILYALLTGRRPFSGRSYQVLLDVLNTPPVRPSALRAELDRELEAICLRCLSKDREERYPSAEALAAALEGFLGGGEGAALRSGRPFAAGLAVLAFAALGVGVALRVLPSSEGPRPQPAPSELERLVEGVVEEPLAAPVDETQRAAAGEASEQLCALSLDDALDELLERGDQLERDGMLTGPAWFHLARASVRCEHWADACRRFAQADAQWEALPEEARGRLDVERRYAMLKRCRELRGQRKNAATLELVEAWATTARRPLARRHALWVSSLLHRQLGRLERALEHAEAVAREFPDLPDGYDLQAYAFFARWKRADPKRRGTADLERGVELITQAIERGKGNPTRPAWVLSRGEARFELYLETRDPSLLTLAEADGDRAFKRRPRLRIARTALLRARVLRHAQRPREARDVLEAALSAVEGKPRATSNLLNELLEVQSELNSR